MCCWVAPPLSIRSNRLLICCQHLCVIYRTMMMHLPPFSFYSPEDPGCPNRHLQHSITCSILTSFSTHYVEDLPCFMIAVVVELKPIWLRTAEDTLVDGSDLLPAALNAADRVLHYRFVRLRPVTRHLLHVSGVESFIELRQCLHGG